MFTTSMSKLNTTLRSIREMLPLFFTVIVQNMSFLLCLRQTWRADLFFGGFYHPTCLTFNPPPFSPLCSVYPEHPASQISLPGAVRKRLSNCQKEEEPLEPGSCKLTFSLMCLSCCYRFIFLLNLQQKSISQSKITMSNCVHLKQKNDEKTISYFFGKVILFCSRSSFK